MMSIYDLIKPVTYDEAKVSIYESLAVVGADTTMWKPLGVYRTLVAAIAVLFSVSTVIVAKLATMGWYELATGQWLTLVARYVYGVLRQEPTFAQGPVSFTNTGGAIYDRAPGEIVIRNPLTGAEYTNLTALTIGSGSPEVPTVTTLDDEGDPILVRAIVAGSDSTSGVGQISELVTGLLNVVVSNTVALVGQPEESDTSVRLQCKEKLAARTANGPEDIYALLARSVKRTDGSAIGVNRVRPTRDGLGNVYLDVATATGQVSGAVTDLTSDLGLINDKIQRTCAPLSVTAHTRSQTGFAIPYTYQVWMLDNSGMSPAQVQALIEVTIPQKLAEVPIGGHVVDGDPGAVYHEYLESLIQSVRAEIFHVELTLPAGDVLVPPGRPPVAGVATCLGINQVAQRIL